MKIISERNINFNEFSNRMIYLKGVLDQSSSILLQTQRAWKKDNNKEKRFVNISNFFFKDLETGNDMDLDGNYTVTNEAIQDSLFSLNNRFNSYGLIHAFEAFKRYVRNDLAFRIRDNDNVFNELKPKYRKVNEFVNCIQEYEEIKKGLDYSFREIKSLLKLYKKFESEEMEFTNAFKTNSFGISVERVATKIEKIRHVIVHNSDDSAYNNVTTAIVNSYLQILASTAYHIQYRQYPR